MWDAFDTVICVRATTAIAAFITWARVCGAVGSAPVWGTGTVSILIDVSVLDANIAMASFWSGTSTVTTWATWSKPDITVLCSPVRVTGAVSVHVTCSVFYTVDTVVGIWASTSVTFGVTSVRETSLTLVSLPSIITYTCLTV